MLKIIFQSYLVIFSIPFITFALDPKNPASICERLIGDLEKNKCSEIANKKNLDWYGAAACNELNDDQIFMTCWEKIIDAHFVPEALDLCTRGTNDSDQDRLNCILGVRNKKIGSEKLKKCEKSPSFSDCLKKEIERQPASQNDFFQDLKIKSH